MLRGSSVSWVRGIPVRSALCVVGDSRLKFHNSMFSWNHVRPLAVFNQSSLLLNASNITSNSVDAFGGGIFARDDANVTITGNSRVHANNASEDGGGVFAMDNALLWVDGNSTVAGNSATSGGGIAAEGNASITLTGSSSIRGNAAPKSGSGGGLAVWDSVNVTLTGDSRVQDNTAFRGGGLFAMDRTFVSCSGCIISNNTAKPGVACAKWEYGPKTPDHPNCVCDEVWEDAVSRRFGCMLVAGVCGGGIAIEGDASVTLAGGSRVHKNVAENGTGGGVSMCADFGDTSRERGQRTEAEDAVMDGYRFGQPSVTLTGASSVEANLAVYGGGMYAVGNARVTLTDGSSVHSNRAVADGGGLLSRGQVRVLLANGSSAHSNTAGGTGGGMQLSGSLVLVGGSSVHDNTAQFGAGGILGSELRAELTDGSSVHSNTARYGPAGGLLLIEGTQLDISNQSMVVNNTCFNDVGGGISVDLSTIAKFDARGRLAST